MLSTSILGAISTVLLLNPHLALGAFLGSLGTQVSPRDFDTSLPFEASILDRREEPPQNPSDASRDVDKALDDVVRSLGRVGVQDWLSYLSETYPAHKNKVLEILDSKPNQTREDKDAAEAEAFKFLFEQSWGSRTSASSGRMPLTVADVKKFGGDLASTGSPDDVFMTRVNKLPKASKITVLQNMFKLLDKESSEGFFREIAHKRLGGEQRDRYLKIIYGERYSASTDYSKTLDEFNNRQKARFNSDAVIYLEERDVNELFDAVVKRFISPFTTGRAKIIKALSKSTPQQAVEKYGKTFHKSTYRSA